MIRLLLIRHGETDWNVQRRYQGHKDTSLNDNGRQQARRMAARLQGQHIDAVYTSDLKRAYETARLLCEPLGITPTPEPRLREMRFGIIEGLTFDEARAAHAAMLDAWLADPNQPPTDGEPLDAFVGRLRDLLADVQHRHDGQTVLLVSHGGSLQEIIRMALHMPPEGRWSFKLENTSLTELHLTGEQSVLVRLNDTCHLNGKHA